MAVAYNWGALLSPYLQGVYVVDCSVFRIKMVDTIVMMSSCALAQHRTTGGYKESSHVSWLNTSPCPFYASVVSGAAPRFCLVRRYNCPPATSSSSSSSSSSLSLSSSINVITTTITIIHQSMLSPPPPPSPSLSSPSPSSTSSLPFSSSSSSSFSYQYQYHIYVHSQLPVSLASSVGCVQTRSVSVAVLHALHVAVVALSASCPVRRRYGLSVGKCLLCVVGCRLLAFELMTMM